MYGYKNLLALFTISVAISACGDKSTNIDPPRVKNSTPQKLFASRIKNYSQRQTEGLALTTSDDNFLNIRVDNLDIDTLAHSQFYIDVDNNEKTGNKNTNGLWDNPGADYMLEDKYLYKSTTNDDSWSWEYIAELDNGSIRESSYSVKIPIQYLQGITPIIKVGFAQLDSHWDVINATPKGSQMESYTLQNITVPPGGDKIRPVIKIVGSQSVKMLKGDISVFNKVLALGAIAIDNVDGDISDKIKTDSSSVDAFTIGTYPIYYRVTDLAGNTTEHARNIEVVSNLNNIPVILIDGNLNDWSGIPAVVEQDGSSIKISSDDEHIYLAITTNNELTHPQIFLDIDQNNNTGFRYYSADWKGIDFIIEDGYLNKYRGDGDTWSWEFDSATIDYVHEQGQFNIIEISIRKSNLENLGTGIKAGFVNADEYWNQEEFIPSANLAAYTLNQTNSLINVDRKDIMLFGDPMLERIVGMQLSTVNQILDLPVHGSVVYSSDMYSTTKSYVHARGAKLLSVLERQPTTGNWEVTKEIKLPFASRTANKNTDTGLELITGALKPMFGIVDAVSDTLIASGGRNIDTHADNSNHGSHWATGHGVWLTNELFVVPDRSVRKLDLYKFNRSDFSTTKVQSIDTPTSVHTINGKRNNPENTYYAILEGSDTSKPGIIKYYLQGSQFSEIARVHLIGNNPKVMGGHHAGFSKAGGKYIYMGSKEGTLNIIDNDTFQVIKTIPVGKGAGHRTLVTTPSGKHYAFITNHSDTFVSVIDTDTNTKVIDITVSGPQRNGTALQSHTARVSPDGKYYYNFATDNGYLFRINTETLALDKVYYTGGTPKQASQPGELN